MAPLDNHPMNTMNHDTIIVLKEFDDDVEDAPDLVKEYGNMYSHLILRAWEKAGFSKPTPLDKPARSWDLCPAYHAECGGKPCLILLPDTARSPMELAGLSDAQCACAENEYPDLDVYYSSAFLWNPHFMLCQPVKVRSGGRWLSQVRDAEQFLPLSRKEKPIHLHNAVFGGGHVFKSCGIVIPRLMEKGKPHLFDIANLLEENAAGKPYRVLSCNDAPCWVLLLRDDKRPGVAAFSSMLLHHNEAPYCKLALAGINSEQTASSIIQLQHPDGMHLNAACLETAIFPDAFPTGKPYIWSLYMVAEELMVNKLDRATAEKARRMSQESAGAGAAVTVCVGDIISLDKATFSPQEMPRGECLRAVVHCMQGSDAFPLCVYLPPTVLNGYSPKVGDSISFYGELRATPDEYCPEYAQKPRKAGKDGDGAWAAHLTLEQLSESSIGLGIAAGAFAEAGWRVVEAMDKNLFSRRYLPLIMVSPRGKTALVFADTVVNGRYPQLPYSQRRAAIKRYMRQTPGIDACHFCRVYLDYDEEQKRYAVSMDPIPDCPEVYNPIPFVTTGFVKTESEAEREEETGIPTCPEALDEAKAARLFMDAQANGEWGAFARWLREDLAYTSYTAQKFFHSKSDYLRYIAERIDWWRESLHVWPHNYTFSCGKVLYGGRRRACMATLFQDEIVALTVFDGKDGLIGRMTTIPRAYFDSYESETREIPATDYDNQYRQN